jgi:SagB-type dehydrogenase family enzyme
MFWWMVHKEVGMRVFGTLGRMVLVLAALGLSGAACRSGATGAAGPSEGGGAVVDLPAPRLESGVSLEGAIAARRSIRSFTDEALTMDEVGQLFWSAQGVTDAQGYRAAPSAGALYPLELYAVLPDGLYHYLPAGHRAELLAEEDLREAVWAAGLRQDALRDAPAVFVAAAVTARTAAKYGDRAERYVYMEAGHAAQNLLLQAAALDLGAVPIGAMQDAQVRSALGLPDDHAPLYLIPVGHPAP